MHVARAFTPRGTSISFGFDQLFELPDFLRFVGSHFFVVDAIPALETLLFHQGEGISGKKAQTGIQSSRRRTSTDAGVPMTRLAVILTLFWIEV